MTTVPPADDEGLTDKPPAKDGRSSSRRAVNGPDLPFSDQALTRIL